MIATVRWLVICVLLAPTVNGDVASLEVEFSGELPQQRKIQTTLTPLEVMSGAQLLAICREDKRLCGSFIAGLAQGITTSLVTVRNDGAALVGSTLCWLGKAPMNAVVTTLIANLEKSSFHDEEPASIATLEVLADAFGCSLVPFYDADTKHPN